MIIVIFAIKIFNRVVILCIVQIDFLARLQQFFIEKIYCIFSEEDTVLFCFKIVAVFTDALIAAQVFSFVTVGSEGISNTLSFALYHLCVNPDVQKKLQNEIDAVISSQEFTYSSLKKMTYMDQIINGMYYHN